MAVALKHRRIAVERPGERARAQQAGVAAEPHRPAHLRNVGLLVEQRDHGAVGVLVGLGGRRGLPAQARAGEADDHVLHPPAEAEVGQPLLQRVARDADFALDASLAEATGDDHAGRVGQGGRDFRLRGAVELVGLEPDDLDLRAALHTGVDQRLADGEVGIAQFDVLAHDRHAAAALGAVESADPFAPLSEAAAAARVQREPVERELGEPGVLKDFGHVVDAVGRAQRDHRFGRYIAEERELRTDLFVDLNVGAGDDHVWLDAHRAQRADGMLRRLGLHLVGGLEVEERRDMDRERAVRRLLVAHLPNRLEEGLTLNVADRAADFDDQYIGVGAHGEAAHALLDRVGDVGHGLDRAAEVVALALALDHGGRNLAHRDGGRAGQVLVEEALVVAEVEVRLRAVVGDEDLAVLVRRHRAGIDVEVRVKLLDRDAQAAAGEQFGEGSGGDALADRADHAAGDEDVARHGGGGAASAGRSVERLNGCRPAC